jgi:hypothetical protein
LIDASLHVTNAAKVREYRIQKLNVSLEDLMIDQHLGKSTLSNKHFHFSLGDFTGSLQKKAIKYIHFKDFKIAVDSLTLTQTIDTAIYHFGDFSTGLNMLDVQTADSIFHLTIDTFNLSYKDRSIKLRNVSFKPNISETEMQRRSAFSITQFSATIGKMDLLGLNFDSMLYKGKIFMDEVVLDKVSASIFKDQGKPIDKNKISSVPGPANKRHSDTAGDKAFEGNECNPR